MDQTDWKILDLLAENARMPIKELSKRVALSNPSVKERILKLEEQGIIEGYTTKINYQKLGKKIDVFILMETINCQAFREFCWSHPDVIECHRIAGKYSYLVKFATDSMASLEDFIDQTLKYGHPSTQIVFSSHYNEKMFKAP
ncbi:Lrp/AsnC family transcriptional regulator [Enterococcus sp. AZ072]|uniref:Lrp/AsnC family transcriptional regulator n=1 Tax=unclassified Enterococcus TaxID=2608891 RepID=UPI003D2DBB7E